MPPSTINFMWREMKRAPLKKPVVWVVNCAAQQTAVIPHRDRVVELLLKGHTTKHWTDSLWWSIGSDIVTSHLGRTCTRPSPWICWTSSRITSQATPAVRLRTLFTVQEILYRVSCLAILSPGKSDQTSCETLEIKSNFQGLWGNCPHCKCRPWTLMEGDLSIKPFLIFTHKMFPGVQCSEEIYQTGCLGVRSGACSSW